MKKIYFSILIFVIVFAGTGKMLAKTGTLKFYVSARANCIDQYKRGKFAFIQLNQRLKYRVSISGRAYFGRTRAKGIFIHFVNNKEDSMAERFVFVKPGDYFYINPGGSRPFVLAFFMKFYSNRNAHRGGFMITCTPVGRRQKDSQYNERDMYRGIKK